MPTAGRQEPAVGPVQSGKAGAAECRETDSRLWQSPAPSWLAGTFIESRLLLSLCLWPAGP